MTKATQITIKNKLVMEKRDINVYHHATRSAHMISHNSSITLPLEPVEEKDYLHISIVSGPGRMDANCVIILPSWLDFGLTAAADVNVTQADSRTMLKIPPGLPTWQLRMTQSRTSPHSLTADRITIGDDGLEQSEVRSINE